MDVRNSDKKMITRKLELEDDLSDKQINKMEKQLIAWGIHLASKFQGEDNYFIVGFKGPMDLLAFELVHGTIKVGEG